MKHLFTFLMILGTGLSLSAQDLPQPLNMEQAIRNHTRTRTGMPGPAYSQNHSEYRIYVKVQPDINWLTGREQVTYHNESRDTLNQVVVRLYPDIYKLTSPRQFPVNALDLHPGVQIDSLVVSGVVVDTRTDPRVRRTGTNLFIRLHEPLVPGGELHLAFVWSSPIPHYSTIRMGHYRNGSLFMAYFYPQISVYDDLDGWDKTEYTGQVEFYNDFSDFTLEVAAPADYLVWGTGILENAKEIYSSQLYSKYTQVSSSDSIIHLVRVSDDPHTEFRAQRSPTWKFQARHVPDVAFALAQHYCWDATSVPVDPANGRRVVVSAVYPPDAPHYSHTASFAAASIRYLSAELPGVPYPYPYSTTFCNGSENGGMEFPMMTNNGAPALPASLVGLTFHEIAHTYFPFYMGINERKYAWMDEGWASFFPAELVDRYDSTYGYWQHEVASYLETAGTEFDAPPIIPSSVLNAPAYREASYYRSSLAYRFLQEALGPLFKTAMHRYIAVWNGKHPAPLDFFRIFDLASGQDLSWFWKPWFYEIAYPDLVIRDARMKGNTLEVTIGNPGGLPLPVELTIRESHTGVKRIRKSCAVWKQGQNHITLSVPLAEKPIRVTLGSDQIPDIHPQDNSWDKF